MRCVLDPECRRLGTGHPSDTGLLLSIGGPAAFSDFRGKAKGGLRSEMGSDPLFRDSPGLVGDLRLG